jgi:hypothetical protein
MTQTDRRKEGRQPFRIEIKISSGGKEDRGTALDISVSGIRIQSSMGVAPGDEIILTLQGSEEMVLMGRVVWSLYQVENLIDWYHMGVESEVLIFRDRRAVGIAQRSQMVDEYLKLLETDEPVRSDSTDNPSES